MESNIIRNAQFISEWDDGDSVIVTPCQVNITTKEVFNIQAVDAPNVNNLCKEYIILNGEEYPVFQISDLTENENEYWYET